MVSIQHTGEDTMTGYYMDTKKVKCTQAYHPVHVYWIEGPCCVTGKTQKVCVVAEELYRFRQGEMIQDALISNTSDELEFLMNGYSVEGWSERFGDEV